MVFCRTEEGASDSEVLVMFVTVDGEGTARSISERHTLLHIWKVGSRKQRRNRKLGLLHI